MATNVLDRTSQAMEDEKDGAWRGAIGTPARWMIHAGNKIRITPCTGAESSATVGYVEIPTPLAAEDSTPDARIPAGHHGYLKFAAAAWLLRMDGDAGDEQKAQAFMQTFNSLIGKE